jgi:hypothetical protein
MIKFIRLAALAAVATAVATPAFAQVAADPKAKAHARIVKALTLTANEDLNFGVIVIDAIAGPETVSITQGGVVTCGSSGNLTCDTTNAQAAEYEVTGSNNMLVDVDTTASDLTNMTSGGGETIQFNPTADFQVTLNSSGVGNPLVFNVGGSIDIDTATAEGRYEGEMEVTVDYN